MRKLFFLKYFFFSLFFSFIIASEANHLIFSRICISPNEAEMIEIYNPTSLPINLNEEGPGAYYITDGTNSNQSKFYYNIVNSETLAWSENIYDFFVSFPENLIVNPESSVLLGLHDPASFNDYYN